MTAMEFTKQELSTGDLWVAEITGASGVVTIDLERDKEGSVTVWGKLTGTTEYKYMGSVDRARYDKDIIFNVDCGTENGTLGLKIVSGTEVASGKGNYA